MGKTAREEKAEYNTGTETIGFKNPIMQLGWAKIDHILTFDPTLSDGAYRTYAMLVYHAQQDGETYVSLDTIGNERDLRRETISAHVKELEEHGLITRISREGTSSITEIEPLPKVYEDMAAVVLHARRNRQNGDLCEKSNTPCAKNLTQERTKEVHTHSETPKANEPTPRENAWKEIAEVFPMTNGVTWQTFDELWQKFPDPRRHAYAIERARKANPAKLKFYFEDFAGYDPDKPKTWGEGTRPALSPRYSRPPPVSTLKVRTD